MGGPQARHGVRVHVLPARPHRRADRQAVDYMIGNGWTPCVEFEDRDKAIAKIDTILGPGYYHNRYWNMWKLPLFGCTDGTQVISEIKECLQTYPDVTVRVIAFDRQRRVQRPEVSPRASVAIRARSY